MWSPSSHVGSEAYIIIGRKAEGRFSVCGSHQHNEEEMEVDCRGAYRALCARYAQRLYKTIPKLYSSA